MPDPYLREPDRDGGPLPDGAEDLGCAVAFDLAVGDLEVPEGARALRVNHPLGDAFAVEVGYLVDEVPVLEDDRPELADRLGGVLVDQGVAGAVGGVAQLALEVVVVGWSSSRGGCLPGFLPATFVAGWRRGRVPVATFCVVVGTVLFVPTFIEAESGCWFLVCMQLVIGK